jgi:uncharacterized protein (DUF2141 family)
MNRIAAAALLLLAAAPARAADLTVTIDGIRNDKGDVYLAVFASPRDWPDGDRASYQEKRAAKPGAITITLTGLAPGTYAAGSYHDENGNGKMDKNFVGMPVEGFAISNDIQPVLAPPRYEEASFTLPEEGLTIALHLRY